MNCTFEYTAESSPLITTQWPCYVIREAHFHPVPACRETSLNCQALVNLLRPILKTLNPSSIIFIPARSLPRTSRPSHHGANRPYIPRSNPLRLRNLLHRRLPPTLHSRPFNTPVPLPRRLGASGRIYTPRLDPHKSRDLECSGLCRRRERPQGLVR